MYIHSSHQSSLQLREDSLLIREVLQVRVHQHHFNPEAVKSLGEDT
jgi:hypothetical protein